MYVCIMMVYGHTVEAQPCMQYSLPSIDNSLTLNLLDAES